jgi:hypothetical protein
LKYCVLQPNEESKFAGDSGNATADVDGSDIKPHDKNDSKANNRHIPIDEEHNENFDSSLWRIEIELVSIASIKFEYSPPKSTPSDYRIQNTNFLFFAKSPAESDGLVRRRHLSPLHWCYLWDFE